MNPWPILFAIAVFLAGVFTGDRWKAGVDAREQIKHEASVKQSTDTLVAKANAIAKGYSDRYDQQSEELTNVRLQLANLPRNVACLDSRTVRVLNSIDMPRVATPTAPIATASSPVAADSPGHESEPASSASVGEIADAMAQCRGGYVKLATQLNAILDIEDARDKAYTGKQ